MPVIIVRRGQNDREPEDYDSRITHCDREGPARHNHPIYATQRQTKDRHASRHAPIIILPATARHPETKCKCSTKGLNPETSFRLDGIMNESSTSAQSVYTDINDDASHTHYAERKKNCGVMGGIKNRPAADTCRAWGLAQSVAM